MAALAKPPAFESSALDANSIQQNLYSQSWAAYDHLPRQDLAVQSLKAQAPAVQPSVPKPLPEPVVIPQRRPGNKERGFVKAYAPGLERHGIDQQTFLKFVDESNEALQGSASLQAVRVAASLVSLVPDPSGISNGIALGMQVAAAAAAMLKSTWKTNTFLDKYNEQMFLPRGLFCLIVTHNPIEAKAEDQFANSQASLPQPLPQPLPESVHPTLQQQVQQQQQQLQPGHPGAGALVSQIGTPEWMHKLKDPYRKSASGLPVDVAPLTFHEDDPIPENGGKPPKQNGFKRFMKSMDSYLDNRALAQYAVENEGDAIMKSQPRQAAFKSRYLDPTHPATTGGLFGLLSGGRVTDKGVEALSHYPTTWLQNQIMSATGQKSSFESVEADPDEEAREKARLRAERSLGTNVAGLDAAQQSIQKLNTGCHKDVPGFTKRILYLSIVDLESVANFNSRVAEPGPGTDGGEGLGEVFGLLASEMTEGLVVL